MEEKRCLRCGTPMSYAFTENIQLGKHSLLFGDWPHLIAGAIRTEIYCCATCGKLEFFAACDSGENSTEGTPQVICPRYGQQHDFDYPRCPFCKHIY